MKFPIFIVAFLLTYISGYVVGLYNTLIKKYSKYTAIDYFDDFLHFFVFTSMPLFLTLLVGGEGLVHYFYFFVIQWIVFLNVNPYPINIDNKFAVMELIPEKYRPDTEFMLQEIKTKKYDYPIIIKPIICSGNGSGISIINDANELEVFLKKTKNIRSYMVQNYLHDHPIEIGVLYEKMPWENEGRVIEIVEKTNFQDNIRDHNSAYSVVHSELIHNVKIKSIFNNIQKHLPNANAVRYDIRLKHINDIESGNFKIVEMNGTMGMQFKDLHAPAWYLRRVIIGIGNIFTLQGYSPISLPFVMWKSFSNMVMCSDYENLFSLYS
jgi:hypothetical protein